MLISLTSPWTAQRSLDSWFDQAFQALDQVRRATDDSVPVNVWHDDATVVVTAAVPGLTPERLEVGLSQSVLTIAGSIEDAPAAEGAWVRRERTAGRFERAVELPWPVDAERIEARLKDGILTVACPRSASDRPRSIQVKAA
jgi:HSP20 family protein